jgi:CheY-like chemotaxis protein
MVIDDDEVSLSLISLLLKSEGFEVTQAGGGVAALKTLAALAPEAQPAAVMTDLHMPGLSGPDLAVELRRTAPHAKLLAMSATPDAAAGYDGFLKKPLDPAAVRALLNGHKSLSESPEDFSQTASQDSNHNQPVLDEAVYEKMARLMPPSAVREVYEACLNDVRARGPEMKAAAAASNLASVRRMAHTLKGSAGMVGAKKLAWQATELELGVYQPEDVLQLIDNLLSCCDELHRILLAKL